MNSSYQGSCFCGKVDFVFSAPILFCSHCHCHYCRQAQGAAFVTWVGAKGDTFSLASGENLLKWYVSTETSQRGFCSLCGSTLFFQSALCPGEIHIVRSYIRPPFSVQPEAHVFYDQRVDWVSIHDDLKKVNSDNEILSIYQDVSAYKPGNKD